MQILGSSEPLPECRSSILARLMSSTIFVGHQFSCFHTASAISRYSWFPLHCLSRSLAFTSPLVRRRSCCGLADQDVRWQYIAPAIIGVVPRYVRVHYRAVEVEAPVYTFRTCKGNEVRGYCRHGSSPNRACRDARIATDLERARKQRVKALVGHHDDNRFRDVDTSLKSDADSREVIERRSHPGFAVAGDEERPAARPAKDEARPHDLRGDQDRSGAAEIFLDPRLTGVANKVVKRRPCIG